MSVKKDRIPAGVRQEFDDVDYWNKLKKSKETFTLKDGTVLTAYEYMKKFMHEAYGKGFYKYKDDHNILQTQEQKKWAIRNNNNTNRDALNVAKKAHKLNNTQYMLEKGVKDLNEPWEETLKIGKVEDALDHLLAITAEELNIKLTNGSKKNILKVYFRIKKLLIHMRKDRLNNKESK